MTESEKQNVIRALNTLAKHKSIYGCQQCSKTAEFALQLIEEQQQILEQQKKPDFCPIRENEDENKE